MTFSRKITCPYCGAVDRIPAEQFTPDLACRQCQRAMFASKPLDVNGEAFRELVATSEVPVLVDFWAPWCAPCKAMAPAYDQAARSMEGRVKFAKLNTDEEQAIASDHEIRGIPTMILFRDGEEAARYSGALTASGIESWLEDHLAEPPA